jgi:hypothetical protein
MINVGDEGERFRGFAGERAQGILTNFCAVAASLCEARR